MESEVTTTPTTPTTPVTTADPVPAAPATSAPESTPATSQPKRLSAREALEATAPTTDAKPVVPAAAATGKPTGPVPAVEPKGPIPFDVHHTALENARTKAATEAVQARDRQWQQEAGWVLQLTPEQRTGARNVVRDLYTNPVGFVARSVSELLQGPQAAALRQALAPLFGNGQPAAESEPQPDVEIRNEQGQVVGHGFSAQRQLQREAFLKKQVLSEVQQQLTPFQREREEAQAREQALRMDREIQANTDTVMTRLTKILGDHREAWAYVDAAMNTGMDAYDAALEARDKFITPNQQARAEQDAAERMRRKANANTSNGAGAVVTPASRPRTAKELSKLMQDMDGAQS